jgi:phosphatidylserine/phosphatidylglycerophosphate/cardiolipin synthase-like enzyme
VFPAILNAVHQRGVNVKILTNNYNTPTCRGYIAPLDYLALNGVEIAYYASTTFMHAKYLHVNGNKTSVSSVNFSWTSFNKNREAGIIMSGSDAAPLISMMHSVFLDDFAAGTPYVVNQTYSASEMATITSKSPYPVVVPPPQHFSGNYVTPKPTVVPGGATVTSFASPDESLKTLLADVTSAKASFQLHMYQITDPTLCTLVEKLHASGINTTLMVSAKIYSPGDSAFAHQCYDRLVQAGMQVRLTPSYYTFSHQKYWIVDGSRMGLSTGNWSPTDYPPIMASSGQYPPYGDANWQRVNRDFNLLVQGNAQFLDIFATTFEEDYQRGSWYSNSSRLL